MPRFRSYRTQFCCGFLFALLGGANLEQAGGQPTSIALQPVPPKTVPPSDYPPGTTIVGQEIILGSVPARVWFEIQFSGWAPECLKVVQAKVDATDTSNQDGGGYAGSTAICDGQPGNGGDLAPARVPCNGRCNANSGPLAGVNCLTSANCGNPPGTGQCRFDFPFAPNGNIACRSALAGLTDPCKFGEPSTCQATGPLAGFCAPGFQDLCDPEWIASPDMVSFPATDISTLDYRWGVAVGPDDCMNDFSPSYLGTLVLDVPANARGTYTIDFVDAETFMEGQCPIPICEYLPIIDIRAALITVPCGRCCFGAGTDNPQCVDGVTANECAAQAPLAIFQANEDCPDSGRPPCPLCALDEHCDDGNACTVDQCERGACENTPIQPGCDDGVFCNGQEICDLGIGCVDGSIPCDPNLCDEEANECRSGIPTVNEWGFVVLACLLLIAAKLRYRRGLGM